ncbi:Trm112 family protein [archaeon]|nr:MAG: Trm112 family protein [archaeon]
MRLITHNFLKCNIKGLDEAQGYPLRIECNEKEIIPSEYSEDLVRNVIRKIDFDALKSACKDLLVGEAIQSLKHWNPEMIESNSEMLKELYHILFDTHVQDGNLICPTTGRKFPVKDGIPNMLLHEYEV